MAVTYDKTLFLDGGSVIYCLKHVFKISYSGIIDYTLANFEGKLTGCQVSGNGLLTLELFPEILRISICLKYPVDSDPFYAAQMPPAKPWEKTQGGTLATTTSAEGLPKPWDVTSSSRVMNTNVESAQDTSNRNPRTDQTQSEPPSTALSQPARPWERGQVGGQVGNSLGSPYNSYIRSPYNSASGIGYGTSSYGYPYGTTGYGSGMYGSGGYYGSYYGNPMHNGMQNGNMYGGLYGRPLYGNMHSGPYGAAQPSAWDPNAPAPPSAWQAMLGTISGVVHFFGRLSFLVDENAHAVHFFISALLQLLDRFGSLYGELARFVLRILGFKSGKSDKEDGKERHRDKNLENLSRVSLDNRENFANFWSQKSN